MGAETTNLTRPDGSPVELLVVDDEVNIAELLGMALRYEGWRATLAHTGREAVSTAKELRPDAVVLDIMLPDSSSSASPTTEVVPQGHLSDAHPRT
jgi:two-component system OmpR family response regulator